MSSAYRKTLTLLLSAQKTSPFEEEVQLDIDPDVAGVFKKILRCAGFVPENNVWSPADGVNGDVVVRLFGPTTTKGGFNPLFKFEGFTPRQLSTHKLSKTSVSKLTNPLIVTDSIIYQTADAELGPDSRDTTVAHLMKPAWLLRKEIVTKWATTLATDPGSRNTTKPDWRVKGLASVMTKRTFTITVKDYVPRVEGSPATERTSVLVEFQVQGRFRGEPGNSHMRILYPSVV